MRDAKKRRVFFALWPDGEAASHLAALAQHLVATGGARVTLPENLHLTLVFAGAVTSAQIDELAAIAADVGAEFCAELAAEACDPHCDLRLDRLSFWPQGGILWAGCRQPPSGQRRLSAAFPAVLATRLATRLRAAGFGIAPHLFIPHVTLARRVRCASLPRLEAPLAWRVREFALMESIPQPMQPRYETLAVFPLDPAG